MFLEEHSFLNGNLLGKRLAFKFEAWEKEIPFLLNLQREKFPSFFQIETSLNLMWGYRFSLKRT